MGARKKDIYGGRIYMGERYSRDVAHKDEGGT